MFDPWVGKIPWRKKWQPNPVFMPGKSHGLRSLVGYSPWGCKESITTERLHFTSRPKCAMCSEMRRQSPLAWDVTLIFSVQLLSCVRLFATPWTAARQASLSLTNSQSLLKLMPIESVMPSNHLVLCCPLLPPPSILPSIRVLVSQFFESGGLSIGVSASASVLPMNIQD